MAYFIVPLLLVGHVHLSLLGLCTFLSFLCECVRMSKAVFVQCGDQCNRSGFEMEGAVRLELDVKSSRQNVLCSEFIMYCFQLTDVCCSSCVCVCVDMCKCVTLLQRSSQNVLSQG